MVFIIFLDIKVWYWDQVFSGADGVTTISIFWKIQDFWLKHACQGFNINEFEFFLQFKFWFSLSISILVCFIEFRGFMISVKLVVVSGGNFHEISSLARISLPAAPRPGWGPGPPRRRNEIHPSEFLFNIISGRHSIHVCVVRSNVLWGGVLWIHRGCRKKGRNTVLVQHFVQ